MLRSPAWCVLSLSARRVLDRVEIELADHGGTDNGKLPVTYDDFVRYGLDRHAIGPAMREAVALGFLEITEAGRAGNAEFRKPNLFRLTYRNTAYANPTNEWEKIGPDAAATLARDARSASAKNISQWGKIPSFNGGNPHRKENPPVGKTHTTGHSGKTPTTLDISGRGANSNRPAHARARPRDSPRDWSPPRVWQVYPNEQGDQSLLANGVEANSQHRATISG